MIDDAVNVICQNETLFICARSDNSSGIFFLPREIIEYILGTRIDLDKGINPRQLLLV